MKMKKLTVLCVMSILGCGLLSGCGNQKDAAVDENTDVVMSESNSVDDDNFVYTLSDTIETEDGEITLMSREQTAESYAEDMKMYVSETPDVMGWTFSYNGTDLSYPMDYSVLSNDGWTISVDDSYSTGAVLNHSDYIETITVSSYNGNGAGEGVSAKEDILTQYGIYDFSVSAVDSDLEKVSAFCINGKPVIGGNVEDILSVCNLYAVGVPVENDCMFYSDIKTDKSGMEYEIRILANKNGKVINFDFYTYGLSQSELNVQK